jgi:C-terminal processing protease CtpA/Prc
MKRLAGVLVVAMAVAMPLRAGEGHKCTASTQDCLNYMKANMSERGWVGIEYDDERMKILRVVEGSPAERAGLKKGDLLVAMNGVDFSDDNADKLKKISYKEMKPGNEVTYTVDRAGMRKSIQVTLGELPDEVIAQWVGSHMIKDHAEEIQVASKE